VQWVVFGGTEVVKKEKKIKWNTRNWKLRGQQVVGIYLIESRRDIECEIKRWTKNKNSGNNF